MPAPQVRGTPRLTGPLVRLDGVPSPTRTPRLRGRPSTVRQRRNAACKRDGSYCSAPSGGRWRRRVGCQAVRVSSAAPVDTQTWRPLLVGRIILVIIGAGWIGIAVTILVDSTGMPSGFDVELLGILILALVIAAGFISIAFSYITVSKDELVIRNFWPRPRHIPYKAIRSVSIGYQGVEVRVRGRRWTTYGWAVQQSNWRSATGKPGRSRASPPTHQGPCAPDLRRADRPAVASARCMAETGPQAAPFRRHGRTRV